MNTIVMIFNISVIMSTFPLFIFTFFPSLFFLIYFNSFKFFISLFMQLVFGFIDFSLLFFVGVFWHLFSLMPFCLTFGYRAGG